MNSSIMDEDLIDKFGKKFTNSIARQIIIGIFIALFFSY
jgi:hypothetical protein